LAPRRLTCAAARARGGDRRAAFDVLGRGEDVLLAVRGAIARGEVGLIFAGAGLAAGVIDGGLYSALVVAVVLTTFVAPPWLKVLYGAK